MALSKIPCLVHSFTNDEMKHRILNVLTKFVSDVDPDRLCDWLVQENVISLEQSRVIRYEHSTPQKRCRALLDLLFTTQHPRAFLVLRQALSDENHYLLEFIDNQEFGDQIDGPTVLQEKIKELEKELKKCHYLNTQLTNERKHLKQRLHHLKTDIKLRNKCDPVLVQTIKTKAAEEKQKAIWSLTILDKELFVVSDKSSEVEVYDSMKLSFTRRWNLKDLVYPVDIGSCSRNKCLYIFDFKCESHSREIFRVDPNGKLIKKWSTGYDWGYGLSVTDESNIILTVIMRNKLNEYSPNGQLIRYINLSSGTSRPITHPLYAVKLANGHFVVSHGDEGDDVHRVCIVDADGKLKKSFGGRRGGSTIGQMNRPFHLSVDGNVLVMVANRSSSRVLLLDSDLELKREILSQDEKQVLRCPRRIILDEPNGRLFLANNNMNSEKKLRDGQILIFDLK